MRRIVQDARRVRKVTVIKEEKKNEARNLEVKRDERERKRISQEGKENDPPSLYSPFPFPLPLLSFLSFSSPSSCPS